MRPCAHPPALTVVCFGCALSFAACAFHLEDVQDTGASVDAGMPDGSAGSAGTEAGTGGSAGFSGGSGGTAGSAGISWPNPDAGLDSTTDDAAPDAPEDVAPEPAPAQTITLRPNAGLDGDGFLAAPILCETQVWDYYQQSSYKALHVGRDVPCSTLATYRAFLRFGLQGLSGAFVQSAMLRFELASKAAPQASVSLLEIQDFGMLQSSDWNQPTLRNLGAVFSTGTPAGWITVDVTQSVADSVAKGAVAFQLRYDDESEDPKGESRWYGITAAEEGASRAPQLVVTFVP